MKFTTHFGLHSQTTRLFESVSHNKLSKVKDGILTLYDVLFQRTYTKEFVESTSSNYNSQKLNSWDFKFELFPLHSQLLGESLLVSFPPLIDMLKFSSASFSLSILHSLSTIPNIDNWFSNSLHCITLKTNFQQRENISSVHITAFNTRHIRPTVLESIRWHRPHVLLQQHELMLTRMQNECTG